MEEPFRRERLALLKLDSWSGIQLWRSLLYETAIVLLLGAAVGALPGLYEHALASRWLQSTTGFPGPFSLGLTQVLPAVVLVTRSRSRRSRSPAGAHRRRAARRRSRRT